jgi:TRAP-type C4-dicarboxylate transport system permease large subunit
VILIAKLVLSLLIPHSSNLYCTALLDTPWTLPTGKAVSVHSYKNSFVVKTGVEVTECKPPVAIILNTEADKLW